MRIDDERADRPQQTLVHRMCRRMATVAAAAAVAAAGVLALGSAAPGVALADDAKTLPAYTSNGFCTTKTVNHQYNFQKKTCTGNYVVNKKTYKFTEKAIGKCPKMGATANLTENWVSPGTGGDPTVLAGYTVSMA